MQLRTVIWETIKVPRYILVGCIAAFVFFSSIVVIPRWDAVIEAMFELDILHLSFYNHSIIIFGVLFAYVSQIDAVLISAMFVLVAIVVALVARDLHEHIILKKTAGIGIIGAVIGAFGIGCSACGPAFLPLIIGASASAAFARLLPFHGKELMIIGIIVLVFTIRSLAKKLITPRVCQNNFK